MTETQPTVSLDPIVLAALREDLRGVAQQIVTVVVKQVPTYRDAFAGPMGKNIQEAVALALGGFLELSSRDVEPGVGTDAGMPMGPVVEGAYRLGRGEARSGRTMEALLAAYRVGARVAWRRFSDTAVRAGLPADQVAHFAELVFAYIDELSAASAAGHADEAETSGRVRQRLLERLGRQLAEGASPATLTASAERVEWRLPDTLTAVLLPPGEVRGTVAALTSRTLAVPEDLPGLEREDVALLLVPDANRSALLRVLIGRDAVVGPTVGWTRARTSYVRAGRMRALGSPSGGDPVDSEAHLVRLVLTSDPEALADLRAQALAPLDDVRPATAEKLTETLRAWLLCRGRRDEVAALLHVHPQTVRYRVTQLRELFGERLDDPERVLELTLALGSPPAPPAAS